MIGENKQISLARRPEGLPRLEDFRVESAPTPTPASGEVLVRTIHISLDPYLRGRMAGPLPYASGYELNEPMDGDVTGQVVASKHPHFKRGDYVLGYLKWGNYSLARAEDLRRVDLNVAPLSAHLGVLGMPGHTAYVGLLDVGKPKPGETVFVSSAASTVGSLVGQIAKMKGCYVAGSTGSDEKVQFCLEECGYDACFNYKSAGRLDKAVRAVCPQGIDVYFENVGGAMLDAVLKNINLFARLPVCGMISQYNQLEHEGIYNLIEVLGKRARMQGFIIEDHPDRFVSFFSDVSQWIREGKIKYREHLTHGIENLPQAFIDMLKGTYLGKSLMQVGPEST